MPVTAALRRWLEARWYAGAPVPFWLAGLSRLYAALAARRRTRDLRRVQSLPVPVIVVGNLSVGGTGKTPVVIALVQALRTAGLRPGVISRGYGGREAGPTELGHDADPRRYGDEPVLIAQRAVVPVVIGRDRPVAGRHLLRRHPEVDIVVCDDGLQHYRLIRDIEIAVVDGRRRHGNGRLLPAGPLREPLQRLAAVDLILINGPRSSDEPGFDLRPGALEPLLGGPRRSLSDFAGASVVHAVAGIGDPERFFTTLRDAGLDIVAHPFPDHHRFRADDLDFGDRLPVLMTEKDAVKCRGFARSHWYAVPVAAELPGAIIEFVLQRLRRTLNKS